MKDFELPAPATMSAAARANEITAILAGAIIRTPATTSAGSVVGPGFLPEQSVHTTPRTEKRSW